MIGFVIPSYQAPDDLKRCKQCIEDNFKRYDVPWEIYVHDNSIDNIFFTAAVNKGIKKAIIVDHGLYQNTYACVINQDVFLEDDAIEKMVKVMESDPDIGIVCACMVPSDDDEICIDTGGLWCIPNGGSLKMSRFEVKPAPVLWATAACWLLRTKMVEEIGLLDENLVHFCSDVDYCFRARAAGWQVWRSDAIGIHRPKSLQLTEEMNLRRNKDTEYLLKKWCGGLFNELSFTWQKGPQEQNIVMYKKGQKINVVG